VGRIDTLVAILSGFIIFPAAFAVGVQPDSGSGLVFITLPNVFQQAFGGVPVVAYLCSVMFYLLLALAALTSTISLHEVATSYLHERYHLTRKRAATWVTGVCMVLASLCSMSLGVGKGYTLFGLTLFDLLDYVTAKVLLPVGGIFISIFVGWYLDKQVVRNELTNDGTLRLPLYRLIILILKYLAPIGIVCIFAKEIGLL
jgi:NSS family neurotransmitter:Na+ symporter